MNAFSSAGETSKVQFGRTLIAYEIRRTRRRSTVSIAVVPKGGIVVTVPEKAPRQRLDEPVRRKGRGGYLAHPPRSPLITPPSGSQHVNRRAQV